MATSSASSSMEASASTSRVHNLTTQNFPFAANLNPLTLRLNRTNYNSWRAQVLPSVGAHNLEGFLLGTSQSTTQFIDVIDPNGGQAVICIINLANIVWNRQDQYIVRWLLSSLSESMLDHVTRCVQAAEI